MIINISSKIKLTLNNLNINSNNNNKNYLSDKALSTKIFAIKYQGKLLKNIELGVNYRHIGENIEGVDKNHVFIDLKYVFKMCFDMSINIDA